MRVPVRGLLPILLGLLASCAQDPFERPGTWSLPPTGLGANDSNLRTMLVNPNDLAAGTSEDSSVGTLSLAPVTRLLTAHRTPLPSQNASEVGGSQSASPAPATPGGAGGTPSQ